MEIQRLVYRGKRKEGVLNVGRIDILSPWRKFKYYEGLNFQIGKIVPLDVAQILAKDYPALFEIKTNELDDKGAYIYHLSDTIEECLAALGDKVTLEVMGEVVSKYFEGHRIRDMRGMKEAKPKPSAKTKPKPKRRRK